MQVYPAVHQDSLPKSKMDGKAFFFNMEISVIEVTYV